jgi:UDP-2-acetamido-2,6-beta-L-arabino-hexul-4-ose reductase
MTDQTSSHTFGITGATGFIGKNLALYLQERGHQIVPLSYRDSDDDLADKLKHCERIVHLAGVNRPQNIQEFKTGNATFTKRLCTLLDKSGQAKPLLYASSIQAELGNPYGKSKKQAEDAVLAYSEKTNAPCLIYRLPNVFGKWCKHNYNSAVATFCHNILNNIPITIHNQDAHIPLVYIDDLMATFTERLTSPLYETAYDDVKPVYDITVGKLARQLQAFHKSRDNLTPGQVGKGLTRALFATFQSYRQPEDFAYDLTMHKDQRGSFAEMLRTPAGGQFSTFTALPGVTRGGHYHHTKSEKFLVVHGTARFQFRHVLNDERYEITTSADPLQVVETVPGWAHDITNIGEDMLVVMLWANETFDPDQPDTIVKEI